MKSVCPISQPESAIKLTLIIPTLNEVDNIEPLILGLERVLRDIAWTVIFVDDNSGDGTFDVIRTLASDRPRIQAIRRIGKRGLSTACIEGMAMAVSPYLAVLDADLQHDEHLLRPMLEMIERDRLDLVVASRFARGGSVGALSRRRALMSRCANALSARLCRVRMSDPMSGFFMVRRSLFQEVYGGLSGHGTKILLDMVTASRRPLACAELPLRFRERLSGESKLDAQVMWEFLYLFSQMVVRRMAPSCSERPMVRL